jgi:signal transduction histidine kinase/CheY-like chemotaxis protein
MSAGAVVVERGALHMNAALEVITGRGRDDIQTVDAWFKVLFGAGAEAERARYEAARARGFRVPTYSLVTRPDGAERTLEITRSLVGDVELWIMTDITTARETHDALARAKDEADLASRARTDFLSHMSHELRTPMNGVLGTLDLLSHTHLTADQREHVETVRASGEQLLHVLADILDYSEIEAQRVLLRHTPFALRVAIEQTARLYERTAKQKGLAFSVDCSGVSPAALGDSHRIRQILACLVANAVKFTPNGRVGVEARTEVAPDSKLLLRVAVHDTGVGLDVPRTEQLFEPFVQADEGHTRNFGGLGLGLSIARGLLALMGGALSVASEPGLGSTFSFCVVLDTVAPAQAKVLARTAKVSSVTAVRATRGLALVVEDNPVNARVAVAMLNRLGFEADLACEGKAALAAIAKQHYDLVLMDCQMPVMDGFEATRRLRASPRTRDMFIVALTAIAVAGDRERCIAMGMDEYLSKPLRAEELSDVLETALGRRARKET